MVFARELEISEVETNFNALYKCKEKGYYIKEFTDNIGVLMHLTEVESVELF
jgi:hypothetical protein